VLPVLFFHGGFDLFSGGFVGVDIFLVISGYLIASIIFTEMRGGTFSLLNFYERRARRILPALFLVVAACIPLAWLWLTPSHMPRVHLQRPLSRCLRLQHLLLHGYFGPRA